MVGIQWFKTYLRNSFLTNGESRITGNNGSNALFSNQTLEGDSTHFRAVQKNEETGLWILWINLTVDPKNIVVVSINKHFKQG